MRGVDQEINFWDGYNKSAEEDDELLISRQALKHHNSSPEKINIFNFKSDEEELILSPINMLDKTNRYGNNSIK